MKYVKALLIIVLVCIMASGCFKDDTAKRRMNKNSIKYFSTKYHIKKSKIKISYSNFHDINKRCNWDCGPNDAEITYNGKTYEIKYNEYRKTYGDDYQYEKISKDLNKYLMDRIPYAKSIKISSLKDDVLATPTKYTGDIENYVNNVMVGPLDDGKTFTSIKIWIEVKDSNEAKQLHSIYRKDIIAKLENLNIPYTITFSDDEDDNEYTSFYYYIVGSALKYWDNVDNSSESYLATFECDRKMVEFDDNEIICK